MKLTTKRLELCSVSESDADNIFTLYSNPDVLRYLPPFPPITREGAAKSVERRMKMEAERGYAPFVIRIRENNEFIGSGGVQPVKDNNEIEIAYHYLPSAWGKGYATEAGVAILEFAFNIRKLDEIMGVAFADNVASCKVLEKIGMRYVGLASYYGIDGLKKYVASRQTWRRN